MHEPPELAGLRIGRGDWGGSLERDLGDIEWSGRGGGSRLKEMAGWLGVGLGSGLADLVDEFAIGPRGLAGLIPVREQSKRVALG